MKVKQYKKVNKASFSVLLLILVFAFWKESPLVAFFGIGFYMAGVSLLRTRVKGILADERQRLVSERAAQASFQILLPLLLFTSIGLMVGSGKEEFYYLGALGTIFSYITCLGILIYLLMYWYFNRQTGGDQK